MWTYGDRSIVITGAGGFIGENVAHRLLETGARLYLAVAGTRPRAPARKVFTADLAVRGSFSRALGDLRVDVVVHAAAVTSPDVCERDPDLARRVNVEGTREVAEWAEARGARMIYFSTDLVYDGRKSFYREEDPPGPTNVYGHTKLAGEEEVCRACSDWAVLRLALSYGPTRGARGDWSSKMRAALARGETLNLFTDQFRTPAYAGDTAEAVLRLAHGQGRGLYHMGGAERVSRHGFGMRLARVYGLPADRILPVRMADLAMDAPRAADCSLNTEKISRELGMTLCDVESGLRRQREAEEQMQSAESGSVVAHRPPRIPEA